MATPALTTFTLHQLGAETKRQVSINPMKVVSVRETVHGSVIISYSPKTSFEVVGEHDKIVDQINQGRR